MDDRDISVSWHESDEDNRETFTISVAHEPTLDLTPGEAMSLLAQLAAHTADLVEDLMALRELAGGEGS